MDPDPYIMKCKFTKPFVDVFGSIMSFECLHDQEKDGFCIFHHENINNNANGPM